MTNSTHITSGFYINLPLGALSLIMISFIRLPDQRQKPEEKPKLLAIINRLDPIGFILFASACVEILLAFQLGGSSYAWNSSTIIGLFVGFGATLVVFTFWESHRGDTAMIPLSMLGQRVVYSSCLTVVSQFGSLQVFAYFLPLWFQTIKGVDPILSGAYFMATAGPLIAATVITGILGISSIFQARRLCKLTTFLTRSVQTRLSSPLRDTRQRYCSHRRRSNDYLHPLNTHQDLGRLSNPRRIWTRDDPPTTSQCRAAHATSFHNVHRNIHSRFQSVSWISLWFGIRRN